jgi:hypothetical protein
MLNLGYNFYRVSESLAHEFVEFEISLPSVNRGQVNRNDKSANPVAVKLI